MVRIQLKYSCQISNSNAVLVNYCEFIVFAKVSILNYCLYMLLFFIDKNVFC